MSKACTERKESEHIFISYTDETKRVIEYVIKEMENIMKELGKDTITSTYYDYEVDYFIISKIREVFEVITLSADSIKCLRKYIREAVDLSLESKIKIQ